VLSNTQDAVLESTVTLDHSDKFEISEYPKSGYSNLLSTLEPMIPSPVEGPWALIDLSQFEMSSSVDVDDFDLSTPAFIAVDKTRMHHVKALSVSLQDLPAINTNQPEKLDSLIQHPESQKPKRTRRPRKTTDVAHVAPNPNGRMGTKRCRQCRKWRQKARYV